MTQEVLDIILDIILIIIGLYLAFFKSYFQEKGKNLATLEDIEEITSKVESIKTDFIRETEKLKLDIQFTNQVKFSLKSEELKALLDFYEKYYLWLNILLDFYFGKYNEDNQGALKEAENIINDAYFRYLISETKAELLINDEELFKHSDKMKIKTLEFQNFISRTISGFSLVIFEFVVYKSSKPPLQPLEEYTKLHDKKMKFIDEYNKEKLSHYKEISPLNAEFQRLCYARLLTMGNEQEVCH